ncbi:questin oxidase family protein [Massilia aerilata]|uniref:Questin oxidase family protein n=1 Tax=Massilia aerilata TaxID=453817 RepID=A0ABW0RX25_9BURK
MSTMSDACRALLLQSLSHGPLYGNRLANHLPMALLALDRLGADAGAMRRFADGYAGKLLPAAASASELDPHDYLGSSGDYPRFVAFFRDRIREAGVDAVLHDWVPVLMPGLAASAFHALIRLAYAIEGGLEDEIALSLAYWASEYAALPLPLDPGEGTLEQIAARLRSKVVDHVFKPGIIIDRMIEIAWDPALGGPPVQPAAAPALHEIARFALKAYAGREDFTLLHIVTGCHAFRIVQPYANDKALARRYLWQAALAAWLTVVILPAGRKKAEEQVGALGEQDIAARAILSSDDHVIKLCHSALCEYREYGDPGYLRIATRKLKLDV